MDQHTQDHKHEIYFVPEKSHWPIIAAVSIGIFAVGAAGMFNHFPFAKVIFITGMLMTVYMIQGWFRNVITESKSGLYSAQMDRSFRWGMFWFIISECWFFLAFFGTLFYVRNFSVPWLGGEGDKVMTHQLLWDSFVAHWPLLKNPSDKFIGPAHAMGALWLPTINTFILITSSVTITIAHHALDARRFKAITLWLGITILLGVTFLFLQIYEYMHAYSIGLTLTSGIYGSTFFILTGFHGLHVTIGSIILIVVWLRNYRRDYVNGSHFSFEAAAWYWHFVDVVWLLLFVYVYVLPLK